jgi:O-antigen ligase
MGLWSQPNQMGAFCMISYPILLWKISDSDPKMKWFVYFLISVTAIFHILSGSRTTLLASAFGICIWLLVLKKPIKFVLMIFMITALAMLAVTFRPSNLTREGGFESVSTFTGRTEIWIAALTLAKEKPIVGYGYGVGGKIFEDPRFYDPKQELWSGSAKVSLHNGYLSAVIGMGILGTLLLYGLLFLPFSRSRKAIKGEYRALMVTVIFMCLLTNFLEGVIGSSSGLVSIILWILWVIAGKFPAINKADFSYGY